MSSDLVSVIIPTYRGDRFIADALACVARQTWTNWEILVIEDGSQGETESIVREFAEANPKQRVEYVRLERNQGQSVARNTGIKLARGEYIALLDVDDRWQPTHLAASVEALAAENADLAYSTVALFDDATGMVIGTWGPYLKEIKEFPYSLLYRCFLAPSAVVFRRDIVERVGLFEPTLTPCEDVDYWIRCAAADVRFALTPGCHVLYRKNHSEAETRGTCRLTETYARVVDRHRYTFKERAFTKLAARLYFGAAWCHATTDRELDPTANPARAAALLLRAAELRKGSIFYKTHGTAARLCERLNSESLRRFYFWCFRPKRFTRLGNLLAAQPEAQAKAA